MRRIGRGTRRPKHMRKILAVSLVGVFVVIASATAFAQGHGRGRDRDDRDERGERGAQPVAASVTIQFGDEHRQAVREYYGDSYGGRCPPGLAKKNNGCMPPGQAKRWERGRPLPPDVVYYQVPPEL